MKGTPPRLAQQLLHRFLREELAEEVTGDLREKFESDSKRSLFRARINYWYQVFNYLRPFAIRKSKSFPINQFDMFQNYFKIAWRNLSGQLMYSFIKIGGFALGIAACVLIAMFIRDEVSYDLNYPAGDRLYRLVGVFNKDGEHLKDVYFPPPLASALKEDYPEVEAVSRINPVELFGAGANEIRRADQDQNTFEEGFIYGDPEWINMLGLAMVYGNREVALNEPNSIVISRRIAEKYFPGADPIGKVFIVNDRDDRPYTVGGVVENMPSNSHIHFDFIITMKGREMWPGEQTGWGSSNYHTYVRLRPGTDPVVLQQKITKGVLEKYFLPMMIEDGVPNPKEVLKNAWMEFQPVTDIHLYSAGIKDGLTHGDIRFVWLFGSVAAFILIIACINFINLSTARSANRAKEVGLRKVVGSYRSNLVQQFLTESVMFSFLSFAIGLGFAALLLPYFNSLAGKAMIFPWAEWWLMPLVFGSTLVIGFVAGLYPALYLSGFKPIQTLKGSLSSGSKSSTLRSSLVIFQFTTSIILIISTFIINRQMGFILNKNVGFEKDQVLLLQGATTLGEKVIPFKQELTRLPGVRNASISDYLPIAGSKRNGNPFWQEGKTKTEQAVGGQYWRVDHDYIKTMGMKIVKGRDFSIDIRSDSQACIINEALAKSLGLSEPVGQKITNSSDGSRTFQVIGVVQDFHFESMKEDIHGVCLRIGRSQGIVSVKMSTQDLPATLEAISKLWKEFSPKQPIRYAFLDDRFATMYADVQRMGRIFTTFAILAIIVACLGLFALSAFMTEQRSKEISIRLVLGATTNSIFNLLTLNFVKLVIISLVVATPIAWFLMKSWLEDFVYRTKITWDVFFLAGMIAIFIALVTISYQSVRAALRNPAAGLRSE
jgi:putative ABC transport system permease protein